MRPTMQGKLQLANSHLTPVCDVLTPYFHSFPFNCAGLLLTPPPQALAMDYCCTLLLDAVSQRGLRHSTAGCSSSPRPQLVAGEAADIATCNLLQHHPRTTAARAAVAPLYAPYPYPLEYQASRPGPWVTQVCVVPYQHMPPPPKLRLCTALSLTRSSVAWTLLHTAAHCCCMLSAIVCVLQHTKPQIAQPPSSACVEPAAAPLPYPLIVRPVGPIGCERHDVAHLVCDVRCCWHPDVLIFVCCLDDEFVILWPIPAEHNRPHLQ